jgi:hypothetical protein
VFVNSSHSPQNKEPSGVKSGLLGGYRIQSHSPTHLLRNTSPRVSVTCLEKCDGAPSCWWSPVKLFECRNVNATLNVMAFVYLETESPETPPLCFGHSVFCYMVLLCATVNLPICIMSLITKTATGRTRYYRSVPKKDYVHLPDVWWFSTGLITWSYKNRHAQILQKERERRQTDNKNELI